MSEGIPYADIIIMALVAGFILLRLRSILGQKTDDNHPDFSQNFSEKKALDSDTVIKLSERSVKSRPPIEIDPYVAELAEGEVKKTIKDVQGKDPLFNATTFLEGARMAFEMVFDAFAKGDKQTLSMLLSQEIYNDFQSDMEEREKNENKQETTLLSVTAKEISRAKLHKNTVKMTVRFESEQVTVERDREGKIIAGDPSDVQNVHDEWVFERDVTSKNPNWKIIEI